MSRCLVLLAVVLAAAPVRAQLEERSLGNPVDLTQKETNVGSSLYGLFNGNREFTKSDQPSLDSMAQLYVYRPTWAYVLTDQDKLADSLKRYENLMNSVAISKQKPVVSYFSAQLVKAFKDVFARPFDQNRSSSLNVAQMLPALGKTKSDEASDYLVELIRDPKMHDSIKLFAVRAMREMFPVKAYAENTVKDAVLDARKKREIERVNALVDYFKYVQASKMDDPVKLYFRREIVTSLAAAGQPAVSGSKKSAKIEGPVAELLVQILSPKSPFEPAPSLPEKLEAAIGLANMKLDDIPEYQSDVAIFLIGSTLMEATDQYRADLANFQAKGADKKPFVHWKGYADRFKLALKAQVANHNGTGLNAQLARAKKLDEQGTRLLDAIERYADAPDPRALWQALKPQLLPSDADLYKSIKSPPVVLE